ncbi:MAG: hypothetical protein P9L92_17045 [Candidatus Electryonea clarkiae]|nr:hypothetical protein [Candidatus Electryonea clarkiae]MDP8288205.1 hypothetical protein [Candidatus Electryonea clarkiae]
MSTLGTRANARINVPVPGELRHQMERLAKRKSISLAELSRDAIIRYVEEENYQAKMNELCKTAEEYSDILDEIAEEWKHTETDGLTNDEL